MPQCEFQPETVDQARQHAMEEHQLGSRMRTRELPAPAPAHGASPLGAEADAEGLDAKGLEAPAVPAPSSCALEAKHAADAAPFLEELADDDEAPARALALRR